MERSRPSETIFRVFFTSFYSDIPWQITFFARQVQLPQRSERSPAFRSHESWTHRVHINQTDFNPHIYSSQQTVVQRVYATSCAFLR